VLIADWSLGEASNRLSGAEFCGVFDYKRVNTAEYLRRPCERLVDPLGRTSGARTVSSSG
jgi:hypothetical protein